MRLARCAAHPRANVKGFRLRKTASWASTAALITAIVTLAALPAHACWDEAAALPRQQRACSTRSRAPNRHSTRRPLDATATARATSGSCRSTPAGCPRWPPTASASAISSTLHQHPRRRVDPRRQRPAPGLHVGCRRCLQRRQSCLAPRLRRQGRRHLRGADDSAYRARHGATRTAVTRGDHRAPVVATCRPLAPSTSSSTQPRDTTHDSDRRSSTATDRPRPDSPPVPPWPAPPGPSSRRCTTPLNWATGFSGKSIAIAAFILGAGIGIARAPRRSRRSPASSSLFMVYVPTIIDSIMTAVI